MQQAHVLGQKFKDIEFEAIYSSDIGRAKATAEIIAQFHHKEVQTSDLIRERFFGRFQGIEADVMHKQLQERYEQADALPKEEHMAFKLEEGVETDQEIVSRVQRFLQIIHDKFADKQILTVCHGALMRVFLIYLDYARYGQFDADSVDNLGYVNIITDGVEIEILEVRGVHLKQ